MKNKKLAIIGSISLSFAAVCVTTGIVFATQTHHKSNLSEMNVVCEDKNSFSNDILKLKVLKSITLVVSGDVSFDSSNIKITSNKGDSTKLGNLNFIVDKDNDKQGKINITASDEVVDEVITISAPGYQDKQIDVSAQLNELNVDCDRTNAFIFGNNLELKRKSVDFHLSGDIKIDNPQKYIINESQDDINFYTSRNNDGSNGFALNISTKKDEINSDKILINLPGYKTKELVISTYKQHADMSVSCNSDDNSSSYNNKQFYLTVNVDASLKICGPNKFKNVEAKCLDENSGLEIDNFIDGETNSNNLETGTINFKATKMLNDPVEVIISADGYQDFTFFVNTKLSQIKFSTLDDKSKMIDNNLILKIGQTATLVISSNIEMKNVKVTGYDSKVIVSNFVPDKEDKNSGTITFLANDNIASFENLTFSADGCSNSSLLLSSELNDVNVKTDENSNYENGNLQLIINKETTISFNGDMDFKNAKIQSDKGSSSALSNLDLIIDSNNKKNLKLKFKTATNIESEVLIFSADNYKNLKILVTTKNGNLNLSLSNENAKLENDNLIVRTDVECDLIINGDFGIGTVLVKKPENSKLITKVLNRNNQYLLSIKTSNLISTPEDLEIIANGYNSKKIHVTSELNEFKFTSKSIFAKLSGTNLQLTKNIMGTLNLSGLVDIKNVKIKSNNSNSCFTDLEFKNIDNNSKEGIIQFKTSSLITTPEQITISADGYKNLVINVTSDLSEFRISSDKNNNVNCWDGKVWTLYASRLEIIDFEGDININNFKIVKQPDNLNGATFHYDENNPKKGWIVLQTDSVINQNVDLLVTADDYTYFNITISIVLTDLSIEKVSSSKSLSYFDASTNSVYFYNDDVPVDVKVSSKLPYTSLNDISVISTSKESDYNISIKKSVINAVISFTPKNDKSKKENFIISSPQFETLTISVQPVALAHWDIQDSNPSAFEYNADNGEYETCMGLGPEMVLVSSDQNLYNNSKDLKIKLLINGKEDDGYYISSHISAYIKGEVNISFFNNGMSNNPFNSDSEIDLTIQCPKYKDLNVKIKSKPFLNSINFSSDMPIDGGKNSLSISSDGSGILICNAKPNINNIYSFELKVNLEIPDDFKFTKLAFSDDIASSYKCNKLNSRTFKMEINVKKINKVSSISFNLTLPSNIYNQSFNIYLGFWD